MDPIETHWPGVVFHTTFYLYDYLAVCVVEVTLPKKVNNFDTVLQRCLPLPDHKS